MRMLSYTQCVVFPLFLGSTKVVISSWAKKEEGQWALDTW